ncbi:MAG: TIGR02186 family protein, partial [Rhodobacteraceae bacterium]|nr:TIGR02186 family protein [Paracoccaceae bacterium]
MIRVLALLLLLPAAAARAGEEVVAGLSQSKIAITANFDGSDLLIYGAVKREEPIPGGPPLEVIVTVEGPSTPIMVRRKSRTFGIWVNTTGVEVDRAPSFYAVATTGPLAEILSQTEDLRQKISVP